MSSALARAHVPTVVPVDNVACTGSNLTWTRAGASEQVDHHELLFILESATTGASSSEYLICCLKEDAEAHDSPFVLSLFQAASIPAQDLGQYIIKELPSYLHHGATNEVDVIVSTKSGMGLASRLWEVVLQPLWEITAAHLDADGVSANDQQAKAGYRLTVTQSANTIRDFSKNLWSSNSKTPRSRTVVLLSGDGGVVDLLNGSAQDSSHTYLPVMAMLPLGTGNALFHSTHKPLYSQPGPTPLVHGIRTLFQGTPTDLPVFRASFSPGSRIVTFSDKQKGSGTESDFSKKETSVSHLNGAIVASYGFHASIVYESDTPEYRVHGDKRFGMVAQELLKESHPYGAQVSIRRPGSSEVEPITRETHAYVLATLVSNLERTFTISPASKPLEGKLRLVHFGPIGGERTMNVMMKAYDEGKHVGMGWDDGEKVGYEEVDEVQVVVHEENERWRKVCIDGTIVDIPKGGNLSVKLLEQGLFKVLAPRY